MGLGRVALKLVCAMVAAMGHPNPAKAEGPDIDAILSGRIQPHIFAIADYPAEFALGFDAMDAMAATCGWDFAHLSDTRNGIAAGLVAYFNANFVIGRTYNRVGAADITDVLAMANATSAKLAVPFLKAKVAYALAPKSSPTCCSRLLAAATARRRRDSCGISFRSLPWVA